MNRFLSVLKNRMKAAGLSEMTTAVVSLGLIAIIGAVVLIVLAGLQTSSQVVANSAAYNAIGNGVTGISTIMQYLPLIALVIVAAVIISIVVLAFAFGKGGRGPEL